ncbi:hypothetical protein XENE109146_13180 [Xenorhabdus nematophila]
MVSSLHESPALTITKHIPFEGTRNPVKPGFCIYNSLNFYNVRFTLQIQLHVVLPLRVRIGCNIMSFTLA